jgi:hypothetical protein
MQTSILQPHVSADRTPEQSGDVQRLAELDSKSPKSAASQNQAAENSNLQQLSVVSVVSIVKELVIAEESPTVNTRSVSQELTPTFVEPTNSPAAALDSLQARSKRSSISPAQLGRRSSQHQTRSHSIPLLPLPPPPSSYSSTPILAQASNSKKDL